MFDHPGAQGARLNTGRRGLVLGAAALLLAGHACALRYEDQDFDDTVSLAGSRLVLNGVGKRAVASIRGYVAGLYLSRKSGDPDTIVAMPGPKRVQLRMLLGVDSNEFVKAVNKGVARNCSEAERAAVSESLPLLMKNFAAVGQVNKKDLVNVDYLPEQGTVLVVNGKQVGPAVAGAPLYVAFLRVFLGEKPTDKRLKEGLLGQPT